MKRLLLLISFIALINFSNAQTSYVWNGSTSTNWNTNTNWTPNGIPGSLDNVTIVTGANNCLLDATKTINNLTITSGVLNLNTFTLNTTGVVACNGGSCNNGTFNSTATTLTFAGTTFGANVTANVTEVYFNGSTFNGSVTVNKNGPANAQSSGNNTFNGITSITNSGTGYLLLTNGGVGRVDNFNATTTINITNTGNLYLGYGRNVNVNANLNINNTSGTGTFFIGFNGAFNLSAGSSINCGTFTASTLNIYKLSQSGSSALNLSPGSAGAVNIYGSAINGSLTINAGALTAQTSTFATTVTYNLSGTILNNWSAGGNVYNGVLTVNNSSNGYIGFGNGTADVFNADVYANNTSTTGGRIIFGNTSNNQFNGNVYVSQSGTTNSSGIAIGWGGTFPIINFAAGKTIIVNGTFSSGYLQLAKIQTATSSPINITTTGTSNVQLNNNTFNGIVNVTSPDIYPNGGTYNNVTVFTKTGGSDNNNNGNQNIFNSTLTINQQSTSGYFMLGLNSNDLFNDNITVTNTGNRGLYLGTAGGTGTPTLASGKTVLIGSAGFTDGFLYFGGFTQLGNSPMDLNLVGLNTAVNFRNSTIGGNLNITSGGFTAGTTTYNGQLTLIKTGSSNDGSPGGNTFKEISSFTNSGNGYFILGNSSPDVFEKM